MFFESESVAWNGVFCEGWPPVFPATVGVGGCFLQRSTVYGPMGGIAKLLKLQDQKTCILRLHDIIRLSLLSPLSSLLSLPLQKKCVSINQINPSINQSIYLSVGLPIYLSFCLYQKYQHAGILS